MCDPIFAELIAWPTALSLFTQMGFDTPTFTDGYIISKPPNSPPLFWHYDWFACIMLRKCNSLASCCQTVVNRSKNELARPRQGVETDTQCLETLRQHWDAGQLHR